MNPSPGANRADFIPDVIWVRRGEHGWAVPLNRADDPGTWAELVDGEDPIIIQVDDGEPRDGLGVLPTSSSSAPRVMRKMLDLLGVGEGMDVLEIGAGTGYNAALLAERVRTGRVTTIELDPGIAEHARRVLARTGLPVEVITGDGVLGYPGNAPYDRVMATASAIRVPYAWVEQTRPGGRIVLPFVAGFRERQAFACLTVDDDDGAARGRFHSPAGFMRLRCQRDDRALWHIWDLDDVPTTTTRAYLHEPFVGFDAGFALGLRLPGWVMKHRREEDGDILLMSHRASGSWASVFPSPAGEHKVAHDGPRRLWEELEDAYRWWIDAGRPDLTRFGLTVAPEGHAVWLDTPDHVVSSR